MTKRERERLKKKQAEWAQLSIRSLLDELEALGFSQGYGTEGDRDEKDAAHLKQWLVDHADFKWSWE